MEVKFKNKLRKQILRVTYVNESYIPYWLQQGYSLSPNSKTNYTWIGSEYYKQLSKAEGVTLYSFLDTADSAEAKARKNVTIGIGYTFDDPKYIIYYYFRKDLSGGVSAVNKYGMPNKDGTYGTRRRLNQMNFFL